MKTSFGAVYAKVTDDKNPITRRQGGEALRRGGGAEVLRQRAARAGRGCVRLFVGKHDEEQQEERSAASERRQRRPQREKRRVEDERQRHGEEQAARGASERPDGAEGGVERKWRGKVGRRGRENGGEGGTMDWERAVWRLRRVVSGLRRMVWRMRKAVCRKRRMVWRMRKAVCGLRRMVCGLGRMS